MTDLIEVSWQALKSSMLSKNITSRLQWILDKDVYKVFLFDEPLKLSASIKVTNPKSKDQHDFETNFKNQANLVLRPTDKDNSVLSRGKTTKSGWHYEPRSLDFYTSKYNSLYNRKHDGAEINSGTDIGDAYLCFFDSEGIELTKNISESDQEFQTRLDSSCVKTVMYWQPKYDMDIIGGILMIKNAPSNPAYVWCVIAPNIPEQYGGNVPFAAGGWNLSFFNDKDEIIINGRGAKFIKYDPVYKSSEFGLIVKHEAGASIGIQMFYEHFKE